MKVTQAFHDINGRKYICLDELRIKVPWRYNRVMCTVKGLTPVQDLVVGQEVCAVYEKVYGYPVLKEISTDETCLRELDSYFETRQK